MQITSEAFGIISN